MICPTKNIFEITVFHIPVDYTCINIICDNPGVFMHKTCFKNSRTDIFRNHAIILIEIM